MKPIHALKAFLLLNLVVLLSCQKEVNDFNFVPPPNPVVGDSTYLDKIYEVYDIGMGMDTQDLVTFTYDAQKRITQWVAKDFVTGAPFTSYSYFYNGSDSIPYKSVFLDYDTSGDPDTTTTFHTYDASLKNLQDSSVLSRADGELRHFILDYSYDAGKKYGFSRAYTILPVPDTIYMKDTASLDASGNVLTSKRYKDEGSGYQLSSTSTYNYDTHLNPFANQWVYKAHQNFPFGETLYYEYIPHNNITFQEEYIIPSSPGPWISWTTSYTYNASGLPAIGSLVDNGDTTTIIYNYKSL